MFLRTAILSLSLGLTAISASQVVMAQPPGEIREQINQHEGTLERKKTALTTLKTRLASYKHKIQDAQRRLDDAVMGLKEAKANVAEADSNTSEDGPRLRDLAARRLELAQHSLESQTARYERVTRKSEELKEEAEELAAGIAKLEQLIARQSAELKSAVAAQQRAAELDRQKALQAQAEAQERAARQRAEEAKREAEQARARELAEAAEAQAASQQSESETEKGQASSDLSSHAAQPERLTPQQRYAREQMKQLNERVKGGDPSEERHFLELLMEINKDRVVELEHLGNNQFYTEVPLEKGKHTININLRKFVATVPEDADGDTFVMIYDASKSKDGRFIIFNKDLL